MASNKYEEAIERSVGWLLTQQNPDGSFNPLSKPAVAFYKVPRALVMAGHPKEAHMLLDCVERECYTQEGDFAGKVGTFHEAHWTYANCWFVWAAQVLSRFDMAYGGMEYLLSHRDPETGGYCSQLPYAKADRDEHQEDLLSTAFTSFVGLHLGLVDEARQAAVFLKRVIEQQPDFTNRLFLRTDGNGELITEVPPDDPEPRHYVIERERGQQLYYFVGAAIAFLAELYTITREAWHLDLAKDLVGFATRCHEDVYRTDAAGKICLGCTHLKRITGGMQYWMIASRIADFLVEDQHHEGYWERGGQPTASSSAEFCVWLGEFARIAG